MEPYAPIEGFFLYVGTYDGNRLLRMRCCQRFDSDRVARAIFDEFKRLNFNPAFKDSGTIGGDKVITAKFKRV